MSKDSQKTIPLAVTLESLSKAVMTHITAQVEFERQTRLQLQSLDSKFSELMEFLLKGRGEREEKMEFSNHNGTIFRDLPKDLVEEILCRVPATCLKRLASICKRWNRLFNGDMIFARKHIDKAAKQFLVLVAKSFGICPAIVSLDDGRVPSLELKSELSLDSHSAKFYITDVYHCDGLLLCTSEYDKSRFVVWNPFTGETRWIKPRRNPSKGLFYFVLGYHQEDNTKSYKVFGFHRLRNDFEIYEFSSDSWRVLDDVIPPGWSIDYSFHNVGLKGDTYWFARDCTKPQVNISLLKFDFSTEKSVPVPLPYQRDFFEVLTLSAVRDEKLSVLLQLDVTSKTEIWVTKKIGDETTQVVTWTKLLALDLSPELQIGSDGTFLLDEEKKVVMICDRWFDLDDETETNMKDCIYIVGEDNEVTQVGFEVDDACGLAILNYVPSLVQIEQAGRKRKRGPDL